jgi:hypothetical protein
VFQKHSITKPYYHGGKYNGKAMNVFMSKPEGIMNDVMEAILTIPEEARCNDAEVLDVTSRFKSILSTFDKIFSMARRKSGFFSTEDNLTLQTYVRQGMKLWREMDLSMEAPKVHAIQDHLCDQMLKFGGIGDLMEDFVEQSHQDGIRDDRRTRTLKNKAVVAVLHSNWEHK